ncbi:MAG: carbonic anhydrase [Deltaproteobacteria bacterium]|nr:carbonic anhydrase [Deltaproteobacteria bacterium]
MPTHTLIAGHGRFKEHFSKNRDFFLALAQKGQSPKVLWVGCSDSRVVPEQIMGADPGELFIIRNIANIVPPVGKGADSVGAAIEYAVLHLQVPHIVICGHTECGGIKALGEALDMEREPHITRWLENARPARERVEASAGSEIDPYLETIKANVLLQMEHLMTYPCVREAVEAGRLTIHGWLYDLHNGDLFSYNDSEKRWTPLSVPGQE